MTDSSNSRGANARHPSEFERLAAEGERKHAAIADKNAELANKARSRNIAIAIGGHYGTPLLRTLAYVHYAGIVALVASIVLVNTTDVLTDIAHPLIGGLALTSFVLVFPRLFIPPLATKGQIDRETAWLRSLPFPVERYFEVLADPPSFYRTLRIALHWSTGREPPATTMSGAIRAIDPNARIAEPTGAEGGTFRFTTGEISGDTMIRMTGSGGTHYVYRNHRITKYVHQLVDKVLIPAHRDYPIAKVTLRE